MYLGSALRALSALTLFLTWGLAWPSVHPNTSKGMLYPRLSESRSVFELGGIWNFRADISPTRDEGFSQKWFLKPLASTGPVIDMPVPSSFNDVTQDESLRSFIGWVWYEKQFYTPFKPDANSRIVLRVESAHYYSMVWFNGQEAFSHVGGHLPFEGEVTKYLNVNDVNRITIAINNTILPTTLPPGDLVYDPDMPSPWTQDYDFDFFNYAGIHRPVKLYTTPSSFIDDINITTNFSGNTGFVNYSVAVIGQGINIEVSLWDRNGTLMATSGSFSGVLKVPDVKLWWPYMMDPDPGYLYTLKVAFENDVYRLPVGIRTVDVEGTQFKINNKSFYFHGLNKHEDADIRGKGLDWPLIMKDINLLKWLGVNAFRTSHYPYSEEIMDLCDRHGIVIIDESPGVGIVKASYMTNESVAHHKDVMFELIRRDKNRPSVVMWSIANEPASDLPEAGPYFKSIFEYTRSLDSRPSTFAHSSGKGGSTPEEDLVTGLCDVLCLNRYQGWYQDPGALSAVGPKLKEFIHLWADYYSKPVIISEYGAGTVAGFHADPPMMYTEDYQVALFKEHFKVFDEMKSNNIQVGELVWNFADFMTKQVATRAYGNRKGIFTRQRQPKAAAHVLRARYLQLAYPHSCLPEEVIMGMN